MCYKIKLFVCLFGFILVEYVESYQAIEFRERSFKSNMDKTIFLCDHTLDNLKAHIYTAMEEDNIGISYRRNERVLGFINHLSCLVNSNVERMNIESHGEGASIENVYNVTKNMGNIWNCTIYTYKNIPYVNNIVYKGNNYTAVNCIMQIHVKPKKFSHVILINSMKAEPVRTEYSEKHVDFEVVYKYAEGDIVTVTCNMSQPVAQLCMQYNYTDALSNANNPFELKSISQLDFRAKLNYKHNNTDIICTYKDIYDYTNVRIKFQQTTFSNLVNVKINEVILRPKLDKKKDGWNYYTMNIILSNEEPVHLICESNRPGSKVHYLDYEFINKRGFFRNTTDTDTRVERYVTLDQYSQDDTLKCSASLTSESVSEMSEITFSKPPLTPKACKVMMDVSPSNIVMEFWDKSNRNMYNEVEDFSKPVTIKCYTYCDSGMGAGPLIELQLNNTDDQEGDERVLKQFTAHENDVILCSLIEKTPDDITHTLGIISVTFIKKLVVTTTSTTTTIPTTTSTTTELASTLSFNSTTPEKWGSDPLFYKWVIVVVAGITCIFIICVSTIICKLRKQNQSFADPNYENLQSQSEASIPPYPSQFNSEYAVPADQRHDDVTYSEPHRPRPDIYSIPIPKDERKKKKKIIPPLYSSADTAIYNNEPANRFIDLDDPNYSEVVLGNANIDENYAKVLPKSERRQQNTDGYANLTNERPYANTGNEGPEPMYCDPNNMVASERNRYINVLNNTGYTNSPGIEYAEPAYCEVNKRK